MLEHGYDGMHAYAQSEQARDPAARRRLRKLGEQPTAPGTYAPAEERTGGAD